MTYFNPTTTVQKMAYKINVFFLLLSVAADKDHGNTPSENFIKLNPRTDGGGDPVDLLNGRKYSRSVLTQ
ncbi:MAG: hypothetical protein MJZ33_04205 [Paludibacteraceae bacterium]|nr:hypothetical protein [Paludibacteraceae bacterium]